jgi:DNA primase
MRFPESFLTELKSRVRLSDVVGRKVKLRKQGRDFVGLSPFSNEKSPSFYVHDDRGFYKCFSTQKAGDAIKFLQETERLSFNEAVEKLANDVGMELPQSSAEDQQVYRQQVTLRDWVERACQVFETQLRRPAGKDAREYLQKRGFGEGAWERHRLGFAPEGWRNLFDELLKQGATAEQLVEAGLVVQAENDPTKYWDRFRNRVIFPITDPSGRVIAFGARTLEPDGKPKYLNSSDSTLFHKGRTLYRYKAAREALVDVKDGPLSRGLIVTEGYVDAIALAEAGIATAVAPLGTALTEEQLEMVWRAGPEPILCFDGDRAGVAAAYRALDRALPMIGMGRTLYFVLLEGGADPDDVIRKDGPDAMRTLLSQALPLVDVLWRRELEREPLDTPERRAGLEGRLNSAIAAIKDEPVRKAYQREIRDRIYWHFRNQGAPRREAQRQGQWDGKRDGKFAPMELRRTGPPPARVRGLALLVRAIESPAVFEQAREALCHASFADPEVTAIRDAAFDALDAASTLDRTGVATHLRALGRKRALELLETIPPRPSLDPKSGEARELLDALEQFPIADAIDGEAKSVITSEEGEGALSSAQHEARLKALGLDRRRMGRVLGETTVSIGSEDGLKRLEEALRGFDDAVEQRRS